MTPDDGLRSWADEELVLWTWRYELLLEKWLIEDPVGVDAAWSTFVEAVSNTRALSAEMLRRIGEELERMVE